MENNQNQHLPMENHQDQQSSLERDRDEQKTSGTPDVKRIVGSLILGSDHPVSVREIRKVIEDVEAERQAEAADAEKNDEELFGDAAKTAHGTPETLVLDGGTAEGAASGKSPLDADIQSAVEELRVGLRSLGLGMDIAEVAGGFRLQTDPECGPWVRRLLNRGKPQRISRPVIETLAIVAYRQPISRSEIESIRGVGVGHVLKALMEMQLVRIVGRSDLPGKPFLFGTTPEFLDHFGLKNLNELNRMNTGVERTPTAEQRAKHVKFSFKGSATDSAADASKDAPSQPGLPMEDQP